MTYSIAERQETPFRSSSKYIPQRLPTFSRRKNPLSDFTGTLVLRQDQPAAISQVPIDEPRLAEVLTAQFRQCASKHEGKIIRQSHEVYQVTVVEYRYKYQGQQHLIYVNPSNRRVEEIAGPIRSFINALGATAESALGRGQFEDAYRAIVRAICMDEATSYEKGIRDSIVRALYWSYVVWIGLAAATFCLATYAIGLALSKPFDSIALVTGIPGVLMSATLMVTHAGFQLTGLKERVITSVVLAGIVAACACTSALLQGIALHKLSAWFPQLFLIATMAIAVLASTSKRSRVSLIEQHLSAFPSFSDIETYIISFDPSETRDREYIKIGIAALVTTIAVCVGTAAYAAKY
ncbi:hypothetical protein C7S18_04495 [Ahniella affigens]|uniref:Uncharacterized protein n=1 Tax=Ahniella affigens TaxID=2021234 RepID=A0A2P1PNT1_9GAMM|nr:hypothetical protein [Ahniella affigens]AVP96500.1 hypothetical protein C7S18_04495 [Ahniella affigens]